MSMTPTNWNQFQNVFPRPPFDPSQQPEENLVPAVLAIGASMGLTGPISLVPVSPSVGAVGVVALDEFADPGVLPTAPTIGPEFRNPLRLKLVAAADNPSPVYYGVLPTTVPANGTFGPVEYLDEPNFENQGDWLAPSGYWTFPTGFAEITIEGSEGGYYKLSQEITLPAGNYTAAIDVAGIGGFWLHLYVGNNLVLEKFSPGFDSAAFTWAGGLVEISVLPVWDEVTDPSFASITGVSIQSVPPAGIVGTALAPGAGVIIPAGHIDLMDGLYVVPTLGVADGVAEVTATYEYC